MTQKQPELTFTFHNPNSSEIMQRFLVRWYAEALVELRKERMQVALDKNKIQDAENSTPVL